MNHEHIDINNIPKLQWACRRGMLELDVLLGNFLNEAYSGLADKDKQLFVKLLGCADPDLFAWLMGHAEPDDKDLKLMVDKIRHHVRTRF